MFKDTGIKGRLRLLVESESLFNDGVAAVLFGLVLTQRTGDRQFAAKRGGRGTQPSFYDGRRHLGGSYLWCCSCCARGTDF
ncbi:hypothetical protein [Bradyrhizobium sp.]|uniref:hypothetical protein n=1 Tax=Bradyrhizobium sp. TaxID=376 RepID=UPI003C7CF3BB